MRTYERKVGRPVGSRDGSNLSERSKVQIGLYPEDEAHLNRLGRALNLSRSGVVRYALEKLNNAI
jgi:hypothetical protein